MGTSFAEIDRAMARGVVNRVFPGAVLAWGIGSELIFLRAYGRADTTCKEAVVPGTVFDLASLTKPLATALALAELIKRGAISPATPLAGILPRTRNTDKADITVDMLLRHTSGLPAHREYFKRISDSDPVPRDSLRQMVLAEALEAGPGTREVYSDLGYILLAWVAEKISGMRLDLFVREVIYRPLGLDALFFISDGKEGRAGVAATSQCPWRGRLIKGCVEDENAWAAGGVEGHAGLFGDGGSVFRLCSEIMAAMDGKETRVLDSGVIRSFMTKVPGMDRVAGFDTPSKENSSAGRFFSKRAVGHLGFTGTSFWMDPETGLIVVLLTNRVHPSRENLKIRKFRPFIHNLIHDSVLLGNQWK